MVLDTFAEGVLLHAITKVSPCSVIYRGRVPMWATEAAGVGSVAQTQETVTGLERWSREEPSSRGPCSFPSAAGVPLQRG